jgi:ketosteroid isomerase-like protein
MSAKKLILDFYKSDALINPELMDSCIHPDIIIDWNSSKGFVQLKRQEILNMSAELQRAYVRSKVRVEDIVESGDTVAIRFSHYAKTIENPREEMLLGHFMAFWKVSDGKLIRSHQMSQPSYISI